MKLLSPLIWPLICFVVLVCHPLAGEADDGANKAKLEQRDQLSTQAMQLAGEGKLDEAIKVFEQVYALEENLFGKAHEELQGTLGILVQIAEAKQDHQAIIGYRQRQFAIAEKLHGPDNYRTKDAAREWSDARQRVNFTPEQRNLLDSAKLLSAQTIQAYQQHQPADGVAAATECLAIHRRILGNQHPDTSKSINNLAGILRLLGDYQRAETLYAEALEIERNVLGEQHPTYAITLANFADLMELTGNYPRAKALCIQSMAVRKAAWGEKHPGYADGLDRLAGLNYLMGDYPEAEKHYLQSLEIRKGTLGEERLDYARTLNALALLYYSRGDFERAEPLFSEAITIRRTELGKQHIDYAESANNLALLYHSMGDYARAEPLYIQTIETLKVLIGEQNPTYALVLSNLAGFYASMGNPSRAEPLYIQAMETQKALLGKQHPDYATSASGLSVLYASMGKYTQAATLYAEVVESRRVVLGEQHPHYALGLNNLAGIYREIGEFAQAETLFKKAVTILENEVGKRHPHYAVSLDSLAGLYATMGDYARAEPLFRVAVEMTLINLELTADVQSQRQQVAMGESLRHQLDNYLTLATKEPSFQGNAYAALLRWKGSVWQRQQRGRLLIDEPSLRSDFEALRQVSSQLSTLILRVPDPEEREDWLHQLDKLTDQREKLERNLALVSAAYREAGMPVTPAQIQTSLPANSMLVDFVEFNYAIRANLENQTKKSWERRLLVHLVSRDKGVLAIDLGEVASINAFVQTWRQDLGQSPEASEAARELRKRIWQPLEEHLEGITMVYVSPDGLLGQFPLAALPGKRQGSYLLEDLSIVMLPIPQALPAMVSGSLNEATDDRFFLVGGVDYEQTVASDASTLSSTPSTPSDSLMLAARGGQWQAFDPLPGTEAEIDTIESLIQLHHSAAHITTLKGGLASEAAFAKNAPGNRYLHVATHGFFAPESVQNAMSSQTDSSARVLDISESSSPKLVGQHPDLLSGLVFAGANHKPDAGTEDGILTAAEVQSLDLRGVDLAVLSACETGLGKTAGGEGIIGLQRAFQLAGARTTITSLWQVDDAATRALMVEFYRNLFERKLSKLESLRQAQLWLLNHPEAIEGRDLTKRGSIRKVRVTDETKTTDDKSTRSLPAYWAAFQVSGDPR